MITWTSSETSSDTVFFANLSKRLKSYPSSSTPLCEKLKERTKNPLFAKCFALYGKKPQSLNPLKPWTKIKQGDDLIFSKPKVLMLRKSPSFVFSLNYLFIGLKYEQLSKKSQYF